MEDTLVDKEFSHGQWWVTVVNHYDNKVVMRLEPSEALKFALDVIKSYEDVSKRQSREPKKEQR